MVILLPDGVEMDVPIEYMVVKDSVFIPTLRASELRPTIKRIAKAIEIKVEMRDTVEEGYMGLMVWRVQ